MKTLTYFALKEEYKSIQSIGDKLAEIDSLIDWSFFRIISESIYFYKTVSGLRINFKVKIKTAVCLKYTLFI